MAISIAARKQKARELQQAVCRRISNLIGLPWGKDKPIESRPMGQTGVDVRLDAEALKLFPFSIECKRQEAWDVQGWIRHAKENQIPGTDWLLVAKRSRQDPVVIMDLDAFFRLAAGRGRMRRTK